MCCCVCVCVFVCEEFIYLRSNFGVSFNRMVIMCSGGHIADTRVLDHGSGKVGGLRCKARLTHQSTFPQSQMVPSLW